MNFRSSVNIQQTKSDQTSLMQQDVSTENKVKSSPTLLQPTLVKNWHYLHQSYIIIASPESYQEITEGGDKGHEYLGDKQYLYEKVKIVSPSNTI